MHLNAKIGQPTPATLCSEGFYFVSPQVSSQSVYDVHVDFANASLGGAWMHDGSFAQEEVALIENVGLATVACFAQEKNFLTREGANAPTPILIEGAERVAHFSAYGSAAARLKEADLVSDQTYKKTAQCVPTNWLAMAAPDYRGEFSKNAWHGAANKKIREAFEDLFSTAHAGFTMAKIHAGNNRQLRINTGQLGCGVFSNSLAISTAAQLLAAKIVGVDEIVFHDYSDVDANGAVRTPKAKELFDRLAVIVSAHFEKACANNQSVQDAVNTLPGDRKFTALIRS